MKDTEKAAAATDTKFEGFTDEERGAMKDRARELKAATRRGSRGKEVDEAGAVLEKIGEMSDSDRAMAERLHALITASAPGLSPKLWYGMPAYARDDKIVCFFQPAQKFKARYATLGFNDSAKLDHGTMWPTAYALTTELTDVDEERIAELVKKAAG